MRRIWQGRWYLLAHSVICNLLKMDSTYTMAADGASLVTETVHVVSPFPSYAQACGCWESPGSPR